MKSRIFFLGLLGFSTVVSAVDLSSYVGYQIIYEGTVTGYIDDKGKEHDEFEGCDYDRILIVDDRYQVTCRTYSYSYSYRPDIVILEGSYGAKAIINGDEYDISL